MCESPLRVPISFTLFQLLNLFVVYSFHPLFHSVEYIMITLYPKKKKKNTHSNWMIRHSLSHFFCIKYGYCRIFLPQRNFPQPMLYSSRHYFVFISVMFAVYLLEKTKKKEEEKNNWARCACISGWLYFQNFAYSIVERAATEALRKKSFGNFQWPQNEIKQSQHFVVRPRYTGRRLHK